MTNQVDVNDRHVRYTATAGQTVFDYDFPLDDAGNLAVYQNGALVDPANYTVDLDAQTVTLDTGATLGDDISIDGLTVLERATGYPVAGGLRASLLNEDQNRAIEIAQELRRDQLRSLSFAKNAPIDMNGALPAADAGKALRWSDDGKSLVNSADDVDGIVAAAQAAQAAAETAQAGAEAAEGTAATAATTASDAADTASAAASTATDQATAAASSATAAQNAIAALSATSTSSVAIATGSKSFTITAGKFFTIGQPVQISSAAGPTNYMHGLVTAYSDTTLTVDVLDIGGSGTHADWNISIAGTQGPTGATGATGAPGSVWYEGSGAPSSGTGIDGDYYLNTANGDVYTKSSGAWGSPVTNLTGPSGSGSGDLLSTNNLSDLASASTARTNLGLGTMATQAAGAVAITGGSITGLSTPSNPSDAAIKSYVDGLAAGLSGRASCRVATTATLTATYSNGTSGVGATLTNSGAKAAFAVDGVTVAVGERVLVKNQSTAAQNGIFTLTTAGDASTNWVLTRATDFDAVGANEIVEGAYTLIEEGTTNTGFLFLMTQHSAITVGTTAINWTQLTVAAQSAGSLTGATLASNVLASSLTSVGTLTGGATGAGFTVALSTSTVTGQLTETKGGTNQTTYAKGDILYASAANTLSKLPVGADGKVLTLASGVPSWATAAGGLINVQTFTSSGTWTKPGSGTWALIRGWGGGGGGGGGTSGAGGGGGAYVERWVLLSSLGSTETVTIGAGGAAVTTAIDGNSGGNTTFGSWLTAYGGGGGGTSGAGGGGGGVIGAGSTGTTATSGTGGAPVGGASASGANGGDSGVGGGGGGVSAKAGGNAWYGGAGGGGGGQSVICVGGNSFYGGGGGGGAGTTVAASGGTSLAGGNGGSGGTSASVAGTAGAQPGGGGGGSRTTAAGSGKGGDGQLIVMVF